MNHSEEVQLYRKPRQVTVIRTRNVVAHQRKLNKRNHSEDDIVLSVLKTPLVKTASPFRRIFSSAEENVDRSPEEEPFNPNDVSIKIRIKYPFTVNERSKIKYK